MCFFFQNFHVHAFVHSDVWNIFQEGNIYVMKNFVTRVASRTLRPVSFNISILLTNLTTINHCPLNTPTIPRHKFEIVELDEIYNIASSYDPVEIHVYTIGEWNLQHYSIVYITHVLSILLWYDLFCIQILLELFRISNLLKSYTPVMVTQFMFAYSFTMEGLSFLLICCVNFLHFYYISIIDTCKDRP